MTYHRTKLSFLLLIYSMLFAQPACAQLSECRAVLKNDTLVLENSKISRSFLWNNGNLQSISIHNKINNRLIIGSSGAKGDVVFPGVVESVQGGRLKVYNVAATASRYACTVAEVVMQVGALEVKRVFRLYPDCPAIACDYYLRGKGGAWRSFAASRDMLKNIEDEYSKAAAEASMLVIDKLATQGNHWRLKTVEFFDASDYNNNLVEEYSRLLYRQESRLRGNLLLARNQLNNAGFFILKEAPVSTIQLQYQGFDFAAKWGEIKVAGIGIAPEDLSDSVWVKGYSVVVGVDESEGDAGLLKALRNYQDHQRVFNAKRDAMIVANTWGDRNRDGRINEKFILQELEAASTLGITHFQIDDGWQKGRSSNSAFGGSLTNIWRNASYWNVDSVKFPSGFSKVLETARKKNIRITLWFNPSVDSSFKNWEKDADVLIHQYKQYGIRMWKIDGVQVTDKRGEINFRKFLDKVTEATDYEAVFNLDVTAGRRFGYNYMHTYGNLFLENRYTDWGNYYPHYTLRNLWQLSKYIPPQRLQIEFLNKWRNATKYPDDDILAPSHYSFDYLFAITMAAQPLAWFEVSSLPPEAFETAQLIEKYKGIRTAFHSGKIFPIGDEPSGFRWTGFQSIGEGKGFFLVFRENNQLSRRVLATLLPRGKKVKLKLVAGEGKSFNAITGDEGNIQFELSNPKSFALYEYLIL